VPSAGPDSKVSYIATESSAGAAPQLSRSSDDTPSRLSVVEPIDVPSLAFPGCQKEGLLEGSHAAAARNPSEIALSRGIQKKPLTGASWSQSGYDEKFVKSL
jgi:hypothetical protein